VNQESDRGFTAAHVACINGEAEALQLLLSHPHIELSSQMMEQLVQLATETNLLIERSFSLAEKSQDMHPELRERTLMYHWHPDGRKVMETWAANAQKCIRMVKERLAVVRKEEAEMIAMQVMT
jgi:ankyrin repeat protein